MGLDMSLYKVKKEIGSFEDVKRVDKLLNGENYKEYEKKFENLMFECGSEDFKYKSIFGEVAYWRKANAIHKWFVDNVQDGIDDCGYYEISKEKIEELRQVCTKVLNSSTLINGQICVGERLVDDKWEKILENGLILKDTEVAEELLPTESGFFFGSTDYDEYYLRDIIYTADMCEAILNFFPWENCYLLYHSSW